MRLHGGGRDAHALSSVRGRSAVEVDLDASVALLDLCQWPWTLLRQRSSTCARHGVRSGEATSCSPGQPCRGTSVGGSPSGELPCSLGFGEEAPLDPFSPLRSVPAQKERGRGRGRNAVQFRRMTF
jgi:hypothetical protein